MSIVRVGGFGIDVDVDDLLLERPLKRGDAIEMHGHCDHTAVLRRGDSGNGSGRNIYAEMGALQFDYGNIFKYHF